MKQTLTQTAVLTALKAVPPAGTREVEFFEELCSIIKHSPEPGKKPDIRITFGKFPSTKEFYVFTVSDVPRTQPLQAAAAKKTVIYRGTNHATAQAKFQDFF